MSMINYDVGDMFYVPEQLPEPIYMNRTMYSGHYVVIASHPTHYEIFATKHGKIWKATRECDLLKSSQPV